QKRKWWVLGIAASHVLLSVFLTVFLLAVWRKGVQGVYLGGLLASIPLFLVSVWVIRFWLPVRWLSVVHLRKLLAIGLPFLPVTIPRWFARRLYCFFPRPLSGVGGFRLFFYPHELGGRGGDGCRWFSASLVAVPHGPKGATRREARLYPGIHLLPHRFLRRGD